MKIEETIKDLISCMETFKGLRKGEINSKKRTQRVAVARQVVSNFIMNEYKVKPGQMSKYIERDRTDFYYMKNLHKAVMISWQAYPDYHKLYEGFKNIWYGENKRKPRQAVKILALINEKENKIKEYKEEIIKLKSEINII